MRRTEQSDKMARKFTVFTMIGDKGIPTIIGRTNTSIPTLYMSYRLIVNYGMSNRWKIWKIIAYFYYLF